LDSNLHCAELAKHVCTRRWLDTFGQCLSSIMWMCLGRAARFT
jgi:hypothetical protein